ncbi:MAG: tRNA (adenosine(37)-N6)-threonylcarbamoyltransferase complex transferase subunit TsaD [Bdellovibrionales bacterium]|nr:tRNA (adenosine(37)-N6)-threonylcarbamoyltransferase complex transferase subunit TsaD [Bdellovibrionales bacterium]
MKILGIETSCDETAVAIVEDGTNLLSSVLYSQIKEHTPYGGVVPEIASRSHVQKLLPVYAEALSQAKLSSKQIDAIAVSAKPGLIGALMTGVTFAKSLSFALSKPLIEVHHIYGHLMAAFLEDPKPQYPLLALIASGGHTTIVQMNSQHDIIVLGKTIDDAAGEALDKAAKLLGLGFPGGPAIEKCAKGGDSLSISFPSAMKDSIDMSFSGLKNALRTHLLSAGTLDEKNKKNIAASFQETIFSTLCHKLTLAMEKTSIQNILVCGGVASNERFRQMLGELPAQLFLTPKSFCTDNAAMIAAAGFYTYQKNGEASLDLVPTSHGSIFI